jgi:hypothetical protein
VGAVSADSTHNITKDDVLTIGTASDSGPPSGGGGAGAGAGAGAGLLADPELTDLVRVALHAVCSVASSACPIGPHLLL